MATKNELIYSVRESLSDFTDDSLLSNEHIFFQIKSMRALLLQQSYAKTNKQFDDAAIQTFCMEMEEVGTGLCGSTTDCTILRSKELVPTTISVQGRSTLTRVGPPIIGMGSYDIIDARDMQVILKDPLGVTSVFLQDGYAYLIAKSISVKGVKCISISGIFEDPEDLENFSTCASCSTTKKIPCFNEDMEIPMPAYMVSTIVDQLVKSRALLQKISEGRDIDNNSVPE